jgi:hypothetical protein
MVLTRVNGYAAESEQTYFTETPTPDANRAFAAMQEAVEIDYLATLTPTALEEVVYRKRSSGAIWHSPQRCPTRLHPCPLHRSAGHQHVQTRKRGEAARDNADFPGKARGDMKSRPA